MSKQPGYQQLSSEVSSAEEYGFAARLPQAGGSGEAKGECQASFQQASGIGGEHMAYPAGAAYAGAPVTGYPVMTTPMAGGMAGPVGMVAVNPLGRRERKHARRHGKGVGGHRRRRVGPVGLLVGLVHSALQSSKERRR